MYYVIMRSLLYFALSLAKEYEDELHDSVLDGVAIAAKRFDWMLGQLKVS
jgi:hypothetical protein